MTGTISNLSEEPIGSPEDLLRYFTEGIKPPPRWGVGLEYERLGVDARTGEAAAYSGPRGIEAILSGMAERFGWDPSRFRAYRTRIQYPVYGWQICLSFEPPLR